MWTELEKRTARVIAPVERPTLAGITPRLERLVRELEARVSFTAGPAAAATGTARVLEKYLAEEDLLTAAQREGDPERYRQHVLYVDPAGRFSLVSLVWLPGQVTGIHDHQTWCVVGVYQGREHEERFDLCGAANQEWLQPTGTVINPPGSITALTPPGDIHRVANPGPGTAISLHIYGMDIRLPGTSIRRHYDQPLAPQGAQLASGPRSVVHQLSPYNAGAPPEKLAESAITPTEAFFVRNHGDLPEIDLETYRLTLGGRVERAQRLSLADLAAFPRVTVTATLQCAGNRRAELLRLKPIEDELPWGGEAIATATWSGVRLRDVLEAAGLTAGARHVAFLGLDRTLRGRQEIPFGGSIPLAKALDPGVLLADTMNGEPLPPIHGAPLRVVVPGYIGARSVKWVDEIEVRTTPSDNYFQSHAYRLERNPYPATDDGSEDMLGELFLSAFIGSPAEGTRVAKGRVQVRGYAVAGGDAVVEEVEVSGDGGASWQPARFESAAQPGVWRIWSAELTLSSGPAELVARARDSQGQTMPETIHEAWNPKGYMNNAWHRVQIQVD